MQRSGTSFTLFGFLVLLFTTDKAMGVLVVDLSLEQLPQRMR